MNQLSFVVTLGGDIAVAWTATRAG